MSLSYWASSHAVWYWHSRCLYVHLKLPSGQLKCSLQPEKLSFAADFDQVSSFGLRGRFPDNIACCGNRNLKVSGDTRVALSFHTCYIFMSDLLRWLGFLLLLVMDTVNINIWWCWNYKWINIKLISDRNCNMTVMTFAHLHLNRRDWTSQRHSSSTPSLSARVNFKCVLYVPFRWKAFPVFV